jgi:cobalt-zinc-cadmium efflux system outer membrane protein
MMHLLLLGAFLMQGPDSTTLTLDEAIRRATATRGRYREAAATMAEARAGRRLAGQVPNPTLSYQHTGDLPQQHLVFEQPIAWLATRGPDRAAAAAGIRRARADSTFLVASVAQEVRRSFFGALAARQGLTLAVDQAALADSLASLARRRFDAGDISRFESDQVAQDARRGHQLLSQAREAMGGADAAFARAIGWAELAPPQADGALDSGLDLPHPSALPEDSVPLLASAVADSAVLAFEYKSAQRGRLPLPSIQGGAEWGNPDLPGQRLSVLGLAVPLPLWNTGGAQAAVARARAERGAALASEVRLEAIRAIAEARARLDESTQRARFARDSLLPAAHALRERALAAYRAGETGVLAVLDALRSEREVGQAAVEDLMAYQAALAVWYALFGRTE